MRKKIAIVPGSFKPPHIGHYKMIEAYSKVCDEVIVLISNPMENSKSLRKINEHVITPTSSFVMLVIYCNNLSNVEIRISTAPSPIKETYDLIENELTDVDVIVGGSNKDGELDKRWISIKKYMAEHNPSITIIDDLEFNAYSINNEFISSSEFRKELEKDNYDISKFIPDHLAENDKNGIMKLIQLNAKVYQNTQLLK